MVIDFTNNQHYLGEFSNNMKNGFGYKSYVTGIFYQGMFKDDQKVDGHVFDLKTKKLIYEGGWGNDLYHGKGVLNRKNGVKYEGDFYYNDLQG